MKTQNQDTIEMPKLKPIPIPTRKKKLFQRYWTWITSIRYWEVIEDYYITLPEDGTRFVIPAGFIFDGASIPRPLWWFLSPTGILLLPGLIHDFGYRYQYLWKCIPKSRDTDTKNDSSPTGSEYDYCRYMFGASQKEWDALFFRVGTQINRISLINWMAWVALGAFGQAAWRKNRNRDKKNKEVYPKAYKHLTREEKSHLKPCDRHD